MPSCVCVAALGVGFQFRVRWLPDVHLCHVCRRVCASRRLASVFHFVFVGLPTFICAMCAVVCLRRDDRRRFYSFVPNVIPSSVFAKNGVFMRRRDDWCLDCRRWFITIVAHGVPRLLLASFAFRSRRRGDRRRDARRLFSNFVSNVIPRIIYAKFGAYLRRCDAASRFANIMPYGIPRLFLA
jgi:hypothetical protein